MKINIPRNIVDEWECFIDGNADNNAGLFEKLHLAEHAYNAALAQCEPFLEQIAELRRLNDDNEAVHGATDHTADIKVVIAKLERQLYVNLQNCYKLNKYVFGVEEVTLGF